MHFGKIFDESTRTIAFFYVKCYNRREEPYRCGLMIILVLPDTYVQDFLSSNEPVHCVVVWKLLHDVHVHKGQF